MERDAIISHGCSNVLRDRLFLNSDFYKVPICKKCGVFCIPKTSKKFGRSIYNEARCLYCKNSECITLEIPYASKLCIQELQSLHICARLRVDKA